MVPFLYACGINDLCLVRQYLLRLDRIGTGVDSIDREIVLRVVL